MSIKSLIKKEDSDQNSEVHTVYGDLVTFLMMLFVLLFVLSYNENKNQDFLTEFQVKFGERMEEAQQSLTTDALLISKIEHYIQEEELEDLTQVIVDEHRVKLILDSPILFDSGKAVIKPYGYEILNGVGLLFRDVLNPLIIEGHTDNVPIHNEEFESNWELSFHRAYSIIKYLIHHLRFKPTQLSGLGYGEFKPLVDNDTDKNRSKNRRIEINVIRISQTNN